MKTYLVGGSVRDKLLGVPANDTDYLVTDSSEDELLKRGLVKVGQSFPVFLDRVRGDEYTLAASVEEDLQRRDLTINAMAIGEDGILIDPFHGKEDLEKKNLRHVNKVNFFSDPLRVIRTARFLVQLPGFAIDPGTEFLMKEVAATNEYAGLPGERIIKELKRILHQKNPSLFFSTLKKTGALSPHFTELKSIPEMKMSLESEALRFAWLCSDLSLTELHSLCTRLGIQNDWGETAGAWIRYRNLKEGPEALLGFFYEIDSFRRPGMIGDLQKLDSAGMKKISRSFDLISVIGIHSIDQKHSGKDISRAIREERLRILRENS